MPVDQRTSPRENLIISMTLADGSRAVTRDICADGLYFMMPTNQVINRWVLFEFSMPEAGLKLTAKGEVLRLDRGAHATGVALKLHTPRLVRLDH